MLFVGAVEADVVDDGGEKFAGGQCVVAAEGGDEAIFAEFFVVGIEGFGYAVGIKDEGVAGLELAFADFAIPVVEGAEDGGGGAETFDGGIAAEDQAGEMAAIDVADAAGKFVVLGEEERGERAAGRVFAEELIDGAEKVLRVVTRDGALAAKIGLQIGHEQGRGDPFAGDVADDEA